MFGRRFADLLLFCVTATELVILFLLTPTFAIADWIYVLQHFIVLAIAITRPGPKVRDYSISSSMAVGVAYLYVAWPAGGLALVTLAAVLSLCKPSGDGKTIRGASGSERSRDEWSLQIRSPPDVPLVHTWRYRIQPTGMEFRHNSPGVGRLGFSRLSHLRRGANTLSTCQMASLHCLGSLPPFSRSLVKLPLT